MIILECANCDKTQELSENLSIQRLNDKAKQFYQRHKTKRDNRYCHFDNIFIRTFKI